MLCSRSTQRAFRRNSLTVSFCPAARRSDFFPTVLSFLRQLSIIGTLLSLPYIRGVCPLRPLSRPARTRLTSPFRRLSSTRSLRTDWLGLLRAGGPELSTPMPSFASPRAPRKPLGSQKGIERPSVFWGRGERGRRFYLIKGRSVRRQTSGRRKKAEERGSGGLQGGDGGGQGADSKVRVNRVKEGGRQESRRGRMSMSVSVVHDIRPTCAPGSRRTPCRSLRRPG